MQKFTKRYVGEIPYIKRVLTEKAIPYLDREEVEEMQTQVSRVWLEDRQRRLKEREPLKSFFIFHGSAISALLCMGMFISFVFGSMWITIPLIIIACVAAWNSNFVSRPDYFDPTPWARGIPFEEFREEYVGEVAGKLDICLTSGCESPLLILEVEYHPRSYTRFLVLRDPESFDYYYVDAWEKPEQKPKEEKTEPVLENKVAELL